MRQRGAHNVTEGKAGQPPAQNDLEGEAYFHPRKQCGDGQHQAGEDQGLRDALPPVAEVLTKEGNAEQAQDDVPVVRK